MIFFPTRKKIDTQNMLCYDNIANEYDDDTHTTCRNFEYFTSEVLNYFFTSCEIKENMKYLDIGVGTGKTLEVKLDNNITVVEFLEKKRCIIDVLDISEKMIQVTKRKFNNKINNYIQKSIFDFKPENKYDIIIAALCDPFLTRDFIKVASDILKINGYLVLIFPSLSWAKQVRSNCSITKTIFNSLEGERHIGFSFCWDENNLWRYLKKNGFYNKTLTKYYLKELGGNNSMSKINEGIFSINKNARFCTTIISRK